MSQNESVLFAQLKSGKSSAFEILYATYQASALRFCYSLLKDHDEAESMVQDVFMQLWERRERLNTEASFQHYLFACLRNKVFDHFKSLKRDQLAIEQLAHKIETIQQTSDEVEITENEKVIAALQEAIGNLPTSRKIIWELRYQKDQSYQEIAEKLDISTHTVKNQLIKAKKFLRQYVDIHSAISILLILFFW